ncbi:YaaL family protein [Paenibacillus sp. N4]|nr:YaaL family protein [Paenibacillus vietnamensis]
MERLRQEIAEAHREWENANRYFNYAVGKDQIDYAIYNIISAEKKYEMLLREAKQLSGDWQAWEGVRG